MRFVTLLNHCKNLIVSDKFNVNLETPMCIFLVSFYVAVIVEGFSVDSLLTHHMFLNIFSLPVSHKHLRNVISLSCS